MDLVNMLSNGQMPTFSKIVLPRGWATAGGLSGLWNGIDITGSLLDSEYGLLRRWSSMQRCPPGKETITLALSGMIVTSTLDATDCLRRWDSAHLGGIRPSKSTNISLIVYLFCNFSSPPASSRDHVFFYILRGIENGECIALSHCRNVCQALKTAN
ncbi:hypothetical protein GB937_009498 [Aspergillus fischeri]|nr:hypothetical protein GB937_009498 [Aspergillus fischeri]